MSSGTCARPIPSPNRRLTEICARRERRPLLFFTRFGTSSSGTPSSPHLNSPLGHFAPPFQLRTPEGPRLRASRWQRRDPNRSLINGTVM